MHPVVHPGVAYLLYSGGLRAADEAPPDGYATLAVLFGAALPDLIDQPLYHLLFDLPSTRTLGHSLLFLIPLCLIVAVAVRRSSLPDAVAVGFAVGALSHPTADALWPLVVGQYAELGFLLWPVLPSPAYEGTKVLFVVGDVAVTSRHVEWPLLAGAVLLWWRDGKPGIEPIADRFR